MPLEERLARTMPLDVTTHALGVEVFGGAFHIIVPKNSSLPIRKTATFTTAGDYQTGVQIKLFEGELYYDTTKGVPYWAAILGQAPPTSYMKAKWVAAALTVPEVVAAQCFISSFVNREVRGQVQVTDQDGIITPAAL